MTVWPLRAVMIAVLLLTGCARPGTGGSVAPSSADPPSIEASRSPSIAASPTEEPSPTATPVPAVELGYGARIQIDEPVDVHMVPSLDASVVGTRPAGPAVIGMDDLLQSGYLFGPVAADGLVWYPMSSPDRKPGWVGMDASAWEALPAECPETAEPTALDFAQLAPAERVACFGERELELVADVAVSGLGGSRMGTWEPAWLAYPIGPTLGVPDTDGFIFGPTLNLAPGVELPELPPGATSPTMRLEVIVHVDDPAADECVIDVPSTAGPEDTEAVRQYCRTQVVATSLRPVP